MKQLSFLLMAVLGLFIASCGGSSGGDASEPVLETPNYLFVQEAQGGSFVQTGADTYQLVLTGVSEHTIYFAERPYTDAGMMTTAEYVASFNWEPDHPTAAVVLEENNEHQDTIIAKLSSPSYDAAARTLSYTVQVVGDYSEEDLDSFSSDSDNALPPSFGRATVFIDDSEVAYCNSSFAYGTVVATPAGSQRIETISIGDTVLASQDASSWQAASVKFSAGAPPANTTMLQIRFSDQTALILSRGTCLVLADGRVKRASSLTPGETIKGANGTDKLVDNLVVGNFKLGLHSISTTNRPDGGAYISVNGVTATTYFWRGVVETQ